MLQRENELLRETISTADTAIEELEGQLQVGDQLGLSAAYLRSSGAFCGADASLPIRQEGGGENGADVASTSQGGHLTPEEYWSPEQQAVEGGYADPYGPISPLPEHDGTECLKWDDSLWSHAEHFRVGPATWYLQAVPIRCMALVFDMSRLRPLMVCLACSVNTQRSDGPVSAPVPLECLQRPAQRY